MADQRSPAPIDSPPLAVPVRSSPFSSRDSPRFARPSSPPLLPIPAQPTPSSSPNPYSPPTPSHLAPPPSYASLTTPLLPSLPSHPRPASHPTHAAFAHDHSDLALPSGFFLLRNKAQGKTLDARGRGTHEGTEVSSGLVGECMRGGGQGLMIIVRARRQICVHPVKQPTLKGSSNSLINNQNNQVLYLDWNG